ncbi:MAG: excinuclease ABC subunit B, partial [Planctomycetota bacterium]
GIKAKYLHSDIDTIERAELLRDLRLGVFDVMIGINLLREGLDLPEVQLVLVLDADREGFLRSTTSLIQTCGRAARHLRGEVVFYADRMTSSLSAAIEESNRRREIQRAYNLEHGVTPRQIRKKIVGPLGEEVAEGRDMHEEFTEQKQIRGRLELVRKEMLVAARDLDFETAIKLRDELRRLEALELEFIG